MTTRLVKATVTTSVLALLTLAGCTAPAEDSVDTGDDAEQETMAPSDEIDSDTGATVEPGLASCEFNPEPSDQQTDGPADYSGDTLESAELRETADAYEVTMTGDFFNPDVLLTDQGQISFTIELQGEAVDDLAELDTTYEAGEMTFSGVRTNEDEVEQDTSPELQDGTFSATYPKDADALAEADPATWVVRVEYDEGIPDEANPDESTRPVTFNCGDGSPLAWEPLQAE